VNKVARSKVLVTGASGFVGGHLISALQKRGHESLASSRTRGSLPEKCYVQGPELGADADWSRHLKACRSVIHLAGRAHVLSDRQADETDRLYRLVNVEGTRILARQAAESGIKHFIFVSSVGAVADSSESPVSDTTPCRPTTPYGKSKLEAEKALKKVAGEHGMEWTIIRPPLVYGLGNPGNMERLLKLIRTGIPLPLASVRNRRSFIYVENLVDLIALCLDNPKAFGKTFLPSDGEDLSTAQLIEKIWKAETGNLKAECNGGGCAAPREARLFHFPPSLLQAAGRLPGLGALRKLTSSLYVDSEPIRRDLGWIPPFTMEEGLRRTLVG